MALTNEWCKTKVVYHCTTDACFWTERSRPQGHYGRVVKATDSNFRLSVSLWERRFKSCWCRLLFFSYLTKFSVILLFFPQVTTSTVGNSIAPSAALPPLQVRTQGTRGRGEPRLDRRTTVISQWK